MTQPAFLTADQALIEEALERLLPPEATPPGTIHQAMRYSVFAGGKRIRPILCCEAARLFSSELHAAVIAGCALEFIHTYSLIHDDLPALDNDDLRRGKPTCHKKFGVAMAILAGDGLLTLAFETLAKVNLDPARRMRIIAEIGAAAGTVSGMVGGQVADIEAEGKPVDAAGLEYIHRSKTAALIRASIVAGALAGGASDEDVERLRRFGEAIGWA
ncbi:MAG TPA: polyprenyl synthetase family protein, partial [Candidatus Acidoferrales bacterium]|nr:polyprenyl synthetase family protein [Candidatus Acidoferrales bacterium]